MQILASSPLLAAVPTSDALEVCPGGSWTAANVAALETLSGALAPQLDRSTAVTLDMTGVRELDTIGAWLIAAGYAEPEMRKPRPEESDMLFTAEPPTNPVNPPKRRRRSDLDRRRSQS